MYTHVLDPGTTTIHALHPSGKKERRKTPAAFTTAINTHSLCCWGPSQFLPVLILVDRALPNPYHCTSLEQELLLCPWQSKRCCCILQPPPLLQSPPESVLLFSPGTSVLTHAQTQHWTSCHSHLTQPGPLHSSVGECLFPLKQIHKIWKSWLLLQMHRLQWKATRNMKNQGNMVPAKECNKFPVTNPKEIEIYKLTKN